MEDIFAILGTGIKFDKKKITKDSALPEIKLDDTVWQQEVQVDEGRVGSYSNWMQLARLQHLHPALVACLERLGFAKPTPVQANAIPRMIRGEELLVTAATGSGKTFAYLIPLFHILKSHDATGIRALVIIPTQELALQIERESRNLRSDETPSSEQLQITLLNNHAKEELLTKEVARKVGESDIVISTPDYLTAMIQSGHKIKLSKVHYVVLDECDMLLSQIFLQQLDIIVTSCSHKDRQVSMFSATDSDAMRSLAESVMKLPVRLECGLTNTAVSNVTQKLVYSGDERGKFVALLELLREGVKPPVLLFVQTKEKAQKLCARVVAEGLIAADRVDYVSTQRDAKQRLAIVESFRQGRLWFLIATDLLARGLDFDGIQLVINYDLPPTAEEYIHRVGRTGRMGKAGQALTYYADRDVPFLRQIVDLMGQSQQEVPAWLREFEVTPELVQSLDKLNQKNYKENQALDSALYQGVTATGDVKDRVKPKIKKKKSFGDAKKIDVVEEGGSEKKKKRKENSKDGKSTEIKKGNGAQKQANDSNKKKNRNNNSNDAARATLKRRNSASPAGEVRTKKRKERESFSEDEES